MSSLSALARQAVCSPNRLSADPSRRVLLLEAGDAEPPLASRIPGAWISLINSEIDWGYHTVPQRRCFDRRLVWPRGKVVGGSGAINALIYMRGSPSDYDRWSTKGAEGWAWKDVLPWFRKTENNKRLAESPLHGSGGELVVDDVPEHDAAEHLWLEAAQQAGLPLNDDFNSGDHFGCGFFQAMINNGERQSPADAFLGPVRDRSNLTVMCSALATRIRFESNRAIAVDYLRYGQAETAYADEIVLAAGSINSPHLMMLSGVGPAGQLQEAGISPWHNLPGVGQSLQDHVNCVVTYATDKPIGLGGMSEDDFLAAAEEWQQNSHRSFGEPLVIDRWPRQITG